MNTPYIRYPNAKSKEKVIRLRLTGRLNHGSRSELLEADQQAWRNDAPKQCHEILLCSNCLRQGGKFNAQRKIDLTSDLGEIAFDQRQSGTYRQVA